MCTVSVLRAGERLRVACNRDERRDRVAAHPPFISRAGELQVLSPQDPQGRGTWIAANSAGLVFALLNGDDLPPQRGGYEEAGGFHGDASCDPARSRHRVPSPFRRKEVPLRSRGLVIPSLAEANSLEHVALRMEHLPVAQFAPFRLVVTDSRDVAEFVPGPRNLGPYRIEVYRLHRPLLFTSSSLGDAIVDGPRRLLFEQMVPASQVTSEKVSARQDAFHAHRWRDRPAVSVHMSRPDACTVSTTIVEVSGRDVRMVYAPAHCAAGTPVGLVIERQNARDTAADRACREYAAV